MLDRPKTIMAFATHHNRVGFCFFIDKQPMDWQLSYKAAKTASNTETMLAKWLEFYAPDIVVTEKVHRDSRKGERAKHLLAVVDRVVRAKKIKLVKVVKQQPYMNKYLQIDELCDRYPQMKAVAPKRRKYFEKEPPYVTLFEALALGIRYLKR